MGHTGVLHHHSGAEHEHGAQHSQTGTLTSPDRPGNNCNKARVSPVSSSYAYAQAHGQDFLKISSHAQI